MALADPDFTPDPTRAVYVQGVIDQQLLYRLTPQIIDLQHKGDAPITVYIDSPGGIVSHMESLLQLLRVGQDVSGTPRRFITVVTSQAASAAADMLAAGNYALAYRSSVILYHGVRVPSDRVLTVEETVQLAQRLKAGNETYAMELARQAEFRAMFRFISLRDRFDEVRASDPDLNDLQCLVSLVAEKLSSSATDVLTKALTRHGRYNALLQYIASHTKHPSTFKTVARGEAAQIKAIIEFECSKNRKNKEWSFLSDGMHRLSDDFFLFHEYLRMFQSPRFKYLCDIFADFLLTPEEQEEISKLSPGDKNKKVAEKVRPTLQPIWSFFVALCHVLQQGENQLSGIDAFWLGLIDDVLGVPNLPTFRLWVEHSAQMSRDAQEEAEAAEQLAKAEAATGA